MAGEDAVSRRRVFFVLDSLADDGLGDHVATLLSRLSRARFEPRVVALRDEGTLGDRIREMRVVVHTLPEGGTLDPLLAVPRLRKMLKQGEADLVHAFHHVAGVVSELAAPKGVPVVRSVARLPRPDDPLVSRLASVVDSLGSMKRSTRFVVGSEGARTLVADHYGVGDVAVVPECVDVAALREAAAAGPTAEEARVRLGLNEGETAVICLTGYQDEIGAEYLLQGLTLARTERPGLRLFMVGHGPAESHARWHAEELRLGDAVLFMRDEGGMPDLLAGADAVVDAAEWPGPSRCGIRAAAVGLPVLHWEDGVDQGELEADFPTIASPPERFAAELVRVLGDPAIMDGLKRSSEALAARSAVTAVAERWADLYEEVVG